MLPRSELPKDVFIVSADPHPDIYKLYTSSNEYVGIAHVPTYERSVFLNGIFRRIKENTNLDLLEESDDEEEFEDTSTHKYVNLDKKVIMKCVYNDRFMKWIPIEIVA